MTYLSEIKRSMNLLNKEEYLIMGQSVKYSGTGLFHTIKHFPEDKKIELPVFEEIQMGMSIGMSLEGVKVCSIFPRMDFLILAMNQLVNHLDKMDKMSDGQFKPKVIIRTAIGSIKPLFPGEQHSQDHSEALKLMCKHIDVIVLKEAKDVYPAYLKAVESDRSTILIELPDKYNDEVFK